MKTENKVFWGGVIMVGIITAVSLIYINTRGNNSPPPSQVAFTNTESSVTEAATHGTATVDSSRQPGVDSAGKQIVNVTSDDLSEEEENSIIQDPQPVPPAERDGGEIAQALRNLRLQTEVVQQQLMVQAQSQRVLQEQVNELLQERQDFQDGLGDVRRSNEVLRSELSGKSLYTQTTSDRENGSSDRLDGSNDYQLTKVQEDQAWIRTPQGRTYIVGEGDWFGNEYVISINSANEQVITTAGELAL